jgi:hypothetical protein
LSAGNEGERRNNPEGMEKEEVASYKVINSGSQSFCVGKYSL